MPTAADFVAMLSGVDIPAPETTDRPRERAPNPPRPIVWSACTGCGRREQGLWCACRPGDRKFGSWCTECFYAIDASERED